MTPICPRPAPRALRRLAAAVGFAAAVLVALPAASASAHVGATAVAGEAGANLVTLSFSHGCAGEATTGLRVQLPAGTVDVVPEDADGWTSTVGGGELAWAGGSVPDHQQASFTASMKIPGQAGEVVFLPTIQVCGDAESAWIDRSDDPEASQAAPRITLAATYAPAAGTTAAPATSAPGTTVAPSSTTTVAPASSSSSSGSTAWVVGVVAVLVVLAVAGVLVVRSRRPGPS